MAKPESNTATFAGGCFWCIEAIFNKIDGVESVISGYTGGYKKHPTYEEVCSGYTGHAEVCQIQFDSSKITYEQLLTIFWQAHDPTTVDRQGNDVGSQYRSAIFYHNPSQKSMAEQSKIEAAQLFKDPIVTEILPLQAFYNAENYHQDYFENNPNVPYCSFVIKPKIDGLLKKGDFWK